MNIKNILPVILLVVLTAGTSLAQEKQPLFYFKVYAGEGSFTPGSDGLYPSSVIGVVNGSIGTYSYSKKGLGAGFNDGFGIEKPIGKIFSLGLDVNFLHGTTLTSNYTVYPPPSTNLNWVSYTGSAAYSVTTFIPNVTANIFQRRGYSIYTRLGLIIASTVNYQNTENYIIQGTTGTLPITENFTQVNKYGIEAGLNMGVGTRFNLWGPLKGTIEISDNLLSVSPKTAHQSGVITEASSIYVDDYITYIKSNSGVSNSSTTAVGNGNGGGSVTAVDTQSSFNQHINNIVVTVGLAFAVK